MKQPFAIPLWLGTNNHTMKNLKYLSITLFIYSFSLFFPRLISAQEAGLSLAPALSEIVLQPGTTVTLSYSLENTQDPSLVTLLVFPFSPSDSFGNIKISDRYDGPMRFTVSEKEMELNKLFLLKSAEQKKIHLQVRAPEGSPEGDYYYSFIAQTKPPPVQETGTSIRSEISIGSPILISVKKSLRSTPNLKIVLFDIISKKTVNFFGKQLHIVESTEPLQAVLTVQNNGNYFTKAHGELTVRSTFGKTTRHRIAPQNILAHWQRTLLSENHSETESLYTHSFLLGAYTIQADIKVGDGSTKMTKSISFVALPITHLLWGITLLITSYFLIKNSIKRRG